MGVLPSNLDPVPPHDEYALVSEKQEHGIRIKEVNILCYWINFFCSKSKHECSATSTTGRAVL